MYSEVTSNNQLQIERDLYYSQLENLKRYQLLFENTSNIIIFMNSDGKIIEANSAALTAYGYELKELLCMNIEDLYEKESEHYILDDFPVSQRVVFEENHQRKNGTYFPVEVSYQTAIMNHKKIILSVIRDITEQKKTKEQLQYLATHDSLTRIPTIALKLILRKEDGIIEVK